MRRQERERENKLQPYHNLIITISNTYGALLAYIDHGLEHEDSNHVGHLVDGEHEVAYHEHTLDMPLN